MKRKVLSILAAIALAVASIHPPQPALADPAYLSITGNPLTAASAPYLVLSGLVGQSACAITVNTAGGTLAVAGHYRGASAWTGAITTTSVTDGTTNQATQTAAGSYAFNCSGMDMIRADGTSATGAPSVTLTAAGGVSKVLGRSGGGSSTTLTAGQGIAIATPSAGNYTISTTFTPSPAATPVSVQAGTGTSVTTPSPGVFVVSNTGVTSVTGSGNIASSGGTVPNVTITNAPTFTGSVLSTSATTGAFSAPNGYYVAGTGGTSNDNMGYAIGSTGGVYTYLSNCQTGVSSCQVGDVYGNALFYSSQAATYMVTDTSGNMGLTGYLELPNSLTAGSCVQAGTNGRLTSTGSACASGGVTSVTGSGNIASSGGTTPNLTFTGTLPVANGGRGVTTGATGQCDTLTSSTTFGTTVCAQWIVNTFTVPAVGATVTITGNDGKLFSMPQYTPILVTDGTHVVEGYANATVSNSATVVMLATNVLFGTAGNTMAANASLSISGMGTTTASSSPPSFTGGVNTGVQCVKSSTGTGGSYNLCPGYFQIVHAGGASNVTSTMSDSSLSVTSGPDGGGDVSGLTLHATGLTSGRCVQSTTGGLLASASAACGTGNGTVTSVTGTANQISVATGTTTPVISIPTNPILSGQLAVNDLYVGANTTGSVNIGLRLGSAAGAFNQSIWIACPPSNATAECNLGGINGDVFTAITGGNALFVLDDGGNLGANSLTGTNLTPGRCLQASTNGEIINAPSGTACFGHQTINIGMGFVSGTVATSSVYPYQQVATYTSGTITKLHAACGTADNGTTVFTFTDVTSSTTIGTIAMTASTTSSTTLGSAFSLTAGHVIHAAVTTAGTATNCGLTVEGTASLLQ